MKKIAVIGAGLSGLTIAKLFLQHTDYHVDIYEKSKSVGGRMASRYGNNYEFDHGAQFFTVKTKLFTDFLKPYLDNHSVSVWNARFVEINARKIQREVTWGEKFPHYTGSPRMTSFAKNIATDLNILFNTKVTKLIQKKTSWTILTDNPSATECTYDYVITCIPSEQALTLIPKETNYYQKISSIEMTPCFCLLVGFDQSQSTPWDAAFISNSILSWVSFNHSKPGRNCHPCASIMSTNQWAKESFTKAPQDIEQEMLAEFYNLIKLDNQPVSVSLKRWRYANCEKNMEESVFIDPSLNLASCGDWALQGRIEAAFLSSYYTFNAIQKRQ